MTSLTHTYGLAAVIGATFTWLFLVLFFFAKPEQPGQQAIARYSDWLERKLRFLRLWFPASRILHSQIILSVVCIGCALATASAIALLLLPIIAFAPRFYLEGMVAKRVARIEELIEAWLNAIANALKASPSLGEAIASSSSLVVAPMSEEIDLLVKEYELGTSLDKALAQFAERIDSRTLSGAVLALQVARNSGGNLPETLENAATALRELARLEGVVRTKTAEGKAQAFVIGAIPIPMVLGLHSMDNHFFDPLVETFAGRLVVAGAVGLWLCAILMTRKILAVDI
jgi:tight adherence protein B